MWCPMASVSKDEPGLHPGSACQLGKRTNMQLLWKLFLETAHLQYLLKSQDGNNLNFIKYCKKFV